MSSSDETDEDTSHLKEAVDTSFFNDHMFDKSKAEITISRHAGPGIDQERLKPSLRKSCEEQHLNDFRVTPEFQKFVAKHLAHFIDNTLKEVERTSPADENAVETGSGIRLFSGSSHVLEHVHDNTRTLTPVQRCSTAKRRKRDKVRAGSLSKDSEVPLEDVESAAVSAEWILSGQCTKGWSVPTRGEVIIIKATEVNSFDKGSGGALQSRTGSDKLSVDLDLKRQKRKKKREQRKLVNSSEEVSNIGVIEPSADSNKVVDADLKRLKKSEKRKRQKLKKKLMLPTDAQDI